MASSDKPFVRLLNSRPKQILFFAGLGLAVLLIAFMIYAILVTPARQPYRDALTQYKNVYNANIAVITSGSSLNASSATDTQFTQSTELVKKALTALQTENDALGKEEVLASGEGKEKYESFTKKINEYVSYNNDMISSMQKVRPVIYACSSDMTNITEDAAGVEAMRTCATNLEKLEGLPNSDYQTLVINSQKLYAEFAVNLEQRAALADPDGADKIRYDSLSDEQTQILEALNTVSTTFSSNLQKNKQAVDITDSAIALDSYLSKKASILQV